MAEIEEARRLPPRSYPNETPSLSGIGPLACLPEVRGEASHLVEATTPDDRTLKALDLCQRLDEVALAPCRTATSIGL